ncbi:unnamed protein product [Larinioides sclopetarius]|uniref:Uncharacterized protein n=1 Tax=Larinioides sclopetarius TaxID=280406 RepID=A0AAV1Z5Y5_9ARAC
MLDRRAVSLSLMVVAWATTTGS